MARVVFTVLMSIVALLLAGVALALLPASGSGLKPEVLSRLGDSGVVNPVTAVLLNFRGYDTLLEVAVLMVAAGGVLGLHPAQAVPENAVEPGNEVLSALVGMLVPLAVLVSGYLLWVGAYAPGGSFQAGAVLGGLGILMSLSGAPMRWPPQVPAERVLLSVGLAVFVAVGVAVAAGGGALLEYPAAAAGMLILVIETALVLSIAMTMVVLFNGALTGGAAGRKDR